MVALALAAYNDCGAVYADIWAKLQPYRDGNKFVQDATREERRETQRVTKLFEEEGRDSRVPSPKAVVKENKNIFSCCVKQHLDRHHLELFAAWVPQAFWVGCW
ncbi:hypothetical protein TraAM80_06221 [Trypanosoma rangeli]|uniref:Uncharacterized protein n=1 Tax=Trypanosoma rangeli TaxID=5698 RepID=A0A3R7MHR7_TRYRA|nr:uncharacterized protein TraAM80_06221 [Trypanosoma rangeli]RNF02699.1 hypothetical protein TraAM80_06221 [Trypanosoma rangeli]|eukprot:RNF02699.1 hypothetical protein TraAM80_06221 [Trypanosoma rangeli]